MGDTLGIVSLSSHAWEWTISTNGLMTVRASSAHGTSGKKKGLDQLDALSWQWLNQHENLVEQVWHTQQGTFRRKRPPDVRDDPMRGQ